MIDSVNGLIGIFLIITTVLVIGFTEKREQAQVVDNTKVVIEKTTNDLGIIMCKIDDIKEMTKNL